MIAQKGFILIESAVALALMVVMLSFASTQIAMIYSLKRGLINRIQMLLLARTFFEKCADLDNQDTTSAYNINITTEPVLSAAVSRLCFMISKQSKPVDTQCKQVIFKTVVVRDKKGQAGQLILSGVVVGEDG